MLLAELAILLPCTGRIAAPGLINSNVKGEIEEAPGAMVIVPLELPLQLATGVVVNVGAFAAATVTFDVTCVPHASVSFTTYAPGGRLLNKLLLCGARITGDGATSSNVKGEPPPTVLIWASMLPVLPLGHDNVVKAAANVGAVAVAIVVLAVLTLPHASFTATVYTPGTRFSNTELDWNGRVIGDGDTNAYWNEPGQPLPLKPVAAVAVTLIVPVALDAQDALFTRPAPGAVLAPTTNVALRILPQPSVTSVVYVPGRRLVNVTK